MLGAESAGAADSVGAAGAWLAGDAADSVAEVAAGSAAGAAEVVADGVVVVAVSVPELGVDHVDVGAACGVGTCHPIAVDLDVPVFTGDDYGPAVLGRHLAGDVGGADIAQHHVVEERRQQHLRIGLERLEGGRIKLRERGVGRREDDVGAAVEHADNVDIGIQLAGDRGAEGAQIRVAGDGL